MSSTLAVTAALALGFAGCSTEGGEEDACVSTEEYFATVYFDVMKSQCSSCHAQGSIGAIKSSFKLAPSSEAGYLQANMEVVRQLAKTKTGEESVLLEKPVGGLGHEGGKIFPSKEDPSFKKLEELARRLETDDAGCPNTQARFLAGVELMSPKETLWKSALVLAARAPTEAELAEVEKGGFEALDAVLDRLMEDEAFYKRVKEKFNDVMLTDFYLQEGIDVIADDDNGVSYDPMWYEQVPATPVNLQKYGATDAEQMYNMLEAQTRRAVAQQPLELVSYIIRNNRPYTEIATADYIVVNPFSAKAYQVSDVAFTNDANPYEFLPTRFGDYETGYPHAGVMSDFIWMSRHPTTPTNRNRHRAKEALFLFLGNDILKAAERPLDITKVQRNQNPTVNDGGCAQCHTMVDPIAAGWRNFQTTEDDNNVGPLMYRPEFGWFDEMWQPGFKGVQMPPSDYGRALPWTMKQVANDPGFAYAGVFMGFRIVTGQEPMVPPADPNDKEFHDNLSAYLGQYYTLSKVADNFRNGGYNFKKMVKELVMSPYFRAKNTAADISDAQLKHLGAVGTAHLMTPEQLNRKLERVVGMSWTPFFDPFDTPNLLATNGDNGYKMLFGGIDSVDVTTRISAPNGIMANVIERMGLEMGCKLVGAEFSLDKADRRLLSFVEPATEPEDVNNYEIPANAANIKANIVHLFQKLHGETLTPTDPEVERTYKLFVETWREGKAKMGQEGSTVGAGFPGECRPFENYITGVDFADDAENIFEDDRLYTGRAWMTVMLYLLTDNNFVYEM